MNRIGTYTLIRIFLPLLLPFLFTLCTPPDVSLYHSSKFKIFPSRIEQDQYWSQAISPSEIHSKYRSPLATIPTERTSWKLSQDLSKFPKFQSRVLMMDALYNLSLEELIQNTTEDQHFKSGSHWEKTNTRDISYSILLAMAITHPQRSKAILMQKVKNGRIMQDTGTGGSWPVSSDRMSWSLAAWEIFKVTGDRHWLQTAYEVIKKSTNEDLNVVWDFRKHLFKGESSFLNWREQSYPKWMQPTDIYNSVNLSTQIVHCQNLKILTQMGRLLGEDTEKYEHIRAALQKSINDHLWLPDKSYYSQYLYGRNYLQTSDRMEALGEAFTILFDIAPRDRQKAIVANTPVLEFGIPCFYPQIPDVPPYHNDAIWPFVQAYWNWAAAKAGNEKVVNHGIASLMRQAGLFLSNKANLVASTGDFEGTALNSNGQLKSVTGMLSAVYRTLAGMNFEVNGLRFTPLIPKAFAGKLILKKVKYRNATLNIEIIGYGNRVKRMYLNGDRKMDAFVSARLEGEHNIKIEMNNSFIGDQHINLVENRFAPEMPVVQKVGNNLHWRAPHDAVKYKIYRNGEFLAETIEPQLENVITEEPSEYQIQSVDESGNTSFHSEPIIIASAEYQHDIEAEYYGPTSSFRTSNYSGYGFLMLSKRYNRRVDFGVRVPDEGKYRIEFRYANGNGPVNNDNKCCIRTLWVNRIFRGAVVFPQRGEDAWDDWGYSNSIEVELKPGYNRLTLSLEDYNENMNGEINQTLIDQFRVTRLEPYQYQYLTSK